MDGRRQRAHPQELPRPCAVGRIVPCHSSSLIEAFNNTVSALASKRLYLGRSRTWRILVLAAILNWQLGPTWMLLAFSQLGIASPGEWTQIGLDRREDAKLKQSEIRRSVKYKRYVKKLKTLRAKEFWYEGAKDAADLMYKGGSAFVGTGTVVLENPDEGDPENNSDSDEEEPYR